MINLVHAVFCLVELSGTTVEENVIRDRRGLEALQLYGSPKMQAAIAFARKTLLDLLQTGSVALTGKCSRELSRRSVTVLESRDYYINIGASELSCPRGGNASDFPNISGLRVSEAGLRREAAKAVPKIKANRVAAFTKRLVQMRRDTKNRPPIRSALQKLAREECGLGPGQFRTAMEEAAKRQPNQLWGNPGRRPQK
jgi:hypothetical protein